MRSQAETVVSAVPNFQQVVNELQVKGQEATSSNSGLKLREGIIFGIGGSRIRF